MCGVYFVRLFGALGFRASGIYGRGFSAKAVGFRMSWKISLQLQFRKKRLRV